MGTLVEKALAGSVDALKNRNMPLARKTMADDTFIDQKRYEIENRCIDLISVGRTSRDDLRIVVAVLNMITELERIGDYASGIAKIVILIGDEPPLKPLIDIPRMCEMTIEMVRSSLKAFQTSDVESAKKIISMDAMIDGLYDQIFRELLTFMMMDPKTISRATRLIWVAHNLERAADRATNVSERVIYSITGKLEDTNLSKY
jgi:phosphate transport system protein